MADNKNMLAMALMGAGGGLSGVPFLQMHERGQEREEEKEFREWEKKFKERKLKVDMFDKYGEFKEDLEGTFAEIKRRFGTDTKGALADWDADPMREIIEDMFSTYKGITAEEASTSLTSMLKKSLTTKEKGWNLAGAISKLVGTPSIQGITQPMTAAAGRAAPFVMPGMAPGMKMAGQPLMGIPPGLPQAAQMLQQGQLTPQGMLSPQGGAMQGGAASFADWLQQKQPGIANFFQNMGG